MTPKPRRLSSTAETIARGRERDPIERYLDAHAEILRMELYSTARNQFLSATDTRTRDDFYSECGGQPRAHQSQ